MGLWNLAQIPNSSTIFSCILTEHRLLLRDGEPSADYNALFWSQGFSWNTGCEYTVTSILPEVISTLN